MVLKYKGFNIRKDLTVRQDKFYSVINHSVLYGSTIDILKKKMDQLLE